MKYRAYGAMLLLLAIAGVPQWAEGSVVGTVHNLSISGPGQFKSQTEDQICVFCHTPHTGGSIVGHWNRQTRPVGQRYQSTTADAVPANRSPSSELCLSCHDGTIALGEMLTPPRGRRFDSNDLGGVHLSGRGRFGSDLSNHHPVAIAYDRSLSKTDPDLVVAEAVGLPLPAGELHCISCHDPHVSENRPFLNKPSRHGELCIDCHQQGGSNWEWDSSAHAQSDAVPSGIDPWKERKPEWKGGTVAENACMNCHAPHNAASAQRLMTDVGERTCLRCHDGSMAWADIRSESRKFNRHPVGASGSGRHETARSEDPLRMSLHVECEDCHNPHASRGGSPMVSFDPGNPLGPNRSTAPFINGNLLGISGIGMSGNPVAEVSYEYQLCFKCHGVPGRNACGSYRCSTAESYGMVRQDRVYNLRDKFDSGSSSLRSYHPIDYNNSANDDEVPSLRLDIPLNRTDSRIYCSDCHNGDTSPASGSAGPSGPHGSRHEGLLAMRYEIGPDNSSPWSGARLCYKCHDAGVLNSDESFPHSVHVLTARASCGTCHDPHGSAVYPHLINFMVRSSNGGRDFSITGSEGWGEPLWEDSGRYSGTCYLNCHGVEHNGTSYGIVPDLPEPEPEPVPELEVSIK